MAGFVISGDWLVGDWADGWILGIEIELARLRFLKQFTSAVAKELVDTDLNLKSCITVLLVDWEVGFGDKGNLLIWCLGAENVA